MTGPNVSTTPSRGPDRAYDPGDALAASAALSAGVIAGVLTAPYLGGSPAAAYPVVAAAVLVALGLGDGSARG